MALIHASKAVAAELDSVWDIVADIDREPEFWHGTKSIKNIRDRKYSRKRGSDSL